MLGRYNSSTTVGEGDDQMKLSGRNVIWWCRKHDFIYELIPFGVRHGDPIRELIKIQNEIENMPVTKATFTERQLESIDQTAIRQQRLGIHLLKFAGSWVVRDGQDLRWANPNYCHDKYSGDMRSEYIPDRRRVDVLRECASIGTIPFDDVAYRLNISDRALSEWIRRRDISYGDWKEWGKTRMTKTIMFVNETYRWTLDELSEAIGIPLSTVRSWISQYYGADYEPPEVPDEPPFTQGDASNWGGDPEYLDKDHQRIDKVQPMHKFNLGGREFWCEECGRKCTLGASGENEYGHVRHCEHSCYDREDGINMR